MIYGIGIDIAKVSRFIKWYENPRMVKRYFHADEVTYIYSKTKEGALQSMAARFAAKEALGKALGTGLTGFTLKDISVSRKNTGQPELKLSGNIQHIVWERGISGVYLSLSHEKEYAIAQVLLEKKE
jgi:holo-[acyl-carrier protein] synthase